MVFNGQTSSCTLTHVDSLVDMMQSSLLTKEQKDGEKKGKERGVRKKTTLLLSNTHSKKK